MNETITYLEDTFGLKVVVGPKSFPDLKKLPLHIRKTYDLIPVLIEGREVVWVKVNSLEAASPFRIAKQAGLMQKLLGRQIVFLFSSLDTYTRKALIKNRVAFIEEGRQIFAPNLMIHLDAYSPQPMNVDGMSPSTQLLLLYHLQVESLEGLRIKQVADRFSYSKMTVSRALKELEELEFSRPERGRGKPFSFEFRGRELWEKTLPHLKSPIRKEIELEEAPLDVKGVRSGFHALAKYSTLSRPKTYSVAIGAEEYKRLKKEDSRSIKKGQVGEYRLEIWAYDPLHLGIGENADPLSSYLIYQNDPDERVQMALEELINGYAWD